MGRALAWAFDARVHGGADTPAILVSVEEFHRSSSVWRLAMMRQVLWPVVVVAMALLVATVVCTMFLPMIQMLVHVQQGVTP